MPSSGILRCVTIVRTDFSEERSAYIIRVTRIGELGITLAVDRRILVAANVVPSSPTLVTRMMVALISSETLIPTRATQRDIPEDGVLIVTAVKTSNRT
jgi:hypothetical protein